MSAAPSTSPDSGVLLDQRYAVEELIARGGMATVHRARDVRLDRTVALKIMHPHLAADEQFRRRFAREARSAARLAHPHVVGVFDQGADGEDIYLSMELVEGRTLRAKETDEGPLRLGEALRITEQVLQALDAAHASGIVHRDIKPENILLDHAGAVKVADFGLARAIGAANSSASGTLLGTVAYISPEVVTRGHCDERSDLYSLGVVLYEMLVGTQPYVGEQPVHIAFQHVHEDIPAPSARVPSMPKEIDALVTWAAAREPRERPRSAATMLQSVRALLAELPDAALDADRDVVPPVELDTRDVPRTTARLKDVDLFADAPLQEFPRPQPAALEDPEADPAVSEAATGNEDPAPDEDDAGTRERVVALPVPRPRRGRHLAVPARAISPLVRATSAVLVVAALALGIFGGARWYLADGPGGDRTVPALAGTTLDDADHSLTTQDLTTSTVEEFSDTVPAGHIVSTSPASGTVIKRDAEVTVVVSKGVETFEVPQVEGEDLHAAREAVEGQGLRLVEDDPEFSETVPEGQVISQSAADSALPADGEVHVVLSRGRQSIEIPDLAGTSGSSARTTLEDAGFTVSTSEAHSGSVPKGSVVSQSPAGGSGHLGDEVELVISRGPEMVKVPDVFRAEEDAAVAKLEDAGFDVDVQYDRGDPVLGLVYEQSVEAGSKEAKGSTVVIKVF